MKFGKKFLLTLSSAVILSSVTACGGDQSYAYDIDFNASVSGTSINFWTPFGSDIQDVVETALDEFERLTGVNVNCESKGSYNDLKKAITLAATTGKYPHIALGYPDHFASYVKSDIIVRLDYYFENDVHTPSFEPVGERFKSEDFYDDYMVENKSIEFDQNGNPYTLGVPFNKSTEVLVFNKTFFNYFSTLDEYKEKIYVPETYSQLESVGTEIIKYFDDHQVWNRTLLTDGSVAKNTGLDNKDIVIDLTGIYKAGTTKDGDVVVGEKNWFKPFSYDSQSNLFITTVRQSGGTYTEIDKQTRKGYMSFNSQETINGLTMLKNLYDKDILGIPADWDEAKYGSNPFKACKTVMTLGSSAGVANDVTAGNKFQIGAAPVLYQSTDKKYVISQGTNLCLLDKGSREERLASWQLLKFLSKYANGFIASQTGYYPSCEYAELPLNGQDESGMWANVDQDGDFIDYATWKTQAEDFLVTGKDRIRAETANVNIDSYISKEKGWKKFIDQPFSGSADIREDVAAVCPWIFNEEYTIQEALDRIYSLKSEYVRS